MSDDNDTPQHPMRRCSDTECTAARKEWFDSVIWPRIRIQMAVQIGATVVFCAGVFLYLSQNSIIAHSLNDTRTYVTIDEHRQTINRIETRIVRVEDLMTDVSSKLDRNLEAVLRAGEKKP